MPRGHRRTKTTWKTPNGDWKPRHEREPDHGYYNADVRLLSVPENMLTAEEVEAGKSPRGGWTKTTLAEWNVPWPPPRGWRRRLTVPERQRI